MRLSWLDVATPLAAVGLTALGAAIGATSESPGVRNTVIIAAAVVAGTVVLAWGARRTARIARINVQARRMLSPDHVSSREAGMKLAAPEMYEPTDGVSRLRETLGQLGARMAGQVKDLAKQTRNLETLVDAIQDPLIATDADDQVLLCNAAMEKFTGTKRELLVGRPIRGLFTRPEVLALHDRARAGTPATGRAVLTTALGSRTFEVTAAPVPAAWGEGVFGVLLFLRDITELAQAVRMQKDFVASAGHELRTPIAAIRMATETLQDGAAAEAPMRDKLLATIESHSLRLEELVRDLMDLSRLETSEVPVSLTAVPLGDVARTLRQAFEPLCAKRRLTLDISFDPALADLRTDERLLMLMLRNLIDNATKFAAEGTTITVRGQRTEWGGESGGARFEVTDRGTGIPLAQQERVWERFYQVDPARTGTGASTRRGTGLGLAIVKQSAEALGGRVGLESVWGEGTRVWVEVPG